MNLFLRLRSWSTYISEVKFLQKNSTTVKNQHNLLYKCGFIDIEGYIAVIRHMVIYGLLLWWPKTKEKHRWTMLQIIQRLIAVRCCWKNTVIILLPKTKDVQQFNDLQPISLLSILSKIIVYPFRVLQLIELVLTLLIFYLNVIPTCISSFHNSMILKRKKNLISVKVTTYYSNYKKSYIEKCLRFILKSVSNAQNEKKIEFSMCIELFFFRN